MRLSLKLFLSCAVVLGCSACEGNIALFSDRPEEIFTPVVPHHPSPEIPPGAEHLPPFEPGPPTLRRLTQTEYIQTVRDIFGFEVEVRSDLEPDAVTHGFTAIGMSSVGTSPRGVEQYEASAIQIAEQVFGRQDVRFLECDPGLEFDEGCVRTFVEQAGLRIFRRPMESEEVERWLAAAQAGSDSLGFQNGLTYVLAGMLQSPNFLYRHEYGQVGEDGLRRLNDYEIATRLSYLLTGSTPDDALLEAAGNGELSSSEGLRSHGERLLELPQARRALAAFWKEHLEIGKLEGLSKDATHYPTYDEALAWSMQQETLRLMEHLVFDAQADIRDMFDTRKTFVDARLAAHYGLPPVGESGFHEVEHHPAAQRRGILGHASILSAQSHVVETSPTHRGIFVRTGLLCQSIPAPPPGVVTELPEPDPDQGPITLRERLTSYSNVPGCGGCHAIMDPIGFGLENFDAVGAWRETDNGLPVDASGSLDHFIFEDATGLARGLREHPGTMDCLTRKFYRHAVGHVESAGEEIVIHRSRTALEESGFDFRALILAVVTDDGFRYADPAQGALP